MSKKILSVCVPTYNRANILDETLSELVLEPSFKLGKIEICISDNASPDNTKDVVAKYTDKYENIIYSRNKENTKIIDGNFPIVGALASGTFIKFLNDYTVPVSGELDKIIKFIEDNMDEKPVVFFSNNNLLNKTNEIIHCDSLDSFVKNTSYWITWVGGAGIWRDDFISIEDRDRSVEKFMWCPDIYLKLVNSGRKAIVYNRQIYRVQSLSSKGGYNIYQIFVNNYLGLFDEYRKTKEISRITLFNEKFKLFTYFLIPWTLNLFTKKNKYTFSSKGAFGIVFKKYFLHPIFYFGFFLIMLTLMKRAVKKYNKC